MKMKTKSNINATVTAGAPSSNSLTNKAVKKNAGI
jgi:hypothetical protein